MSRVLTVVFVGIILSLAGRAFAVDQVLVLTSSDASLQQKLEKELSTLGLTALMQPDDVGYSLETLAYDAGQHAAIRVNMESRQVEVWVASVDTGKQATRRIAVLEESQSMESIFVLIAVELLRATLLEVYTASSAASTGTAEETPSDIPAAEREAVQAKPIPIEEPPASLFPNERSMAFNVVLGSGMGVLGKKTTVAVNAHLTLGLQFRERFGISLKGMLPLHGHHISRQLADVKLYPFLAGVQGTVRINVGLPWLQLDVGPGYGTLFIVSRTRMNDGAVGAIRDGNSRIAQDDFIVTSVPFLHGGMRFPLARQLAMRIGCLLGWSLSRNEVHMLDIVVTQLGRPLFSAQLAMEVRLW